MSQEDQLPVESELNQENNIAPPQEGEQTVNPQDGEQQVNQETQNQEKSGEDQNNVTSGNNLNATEQTQPTETNIAPTKSDIELPITDEKPAITEEQPANTEEKPAEGEEKPAVVEEKPAEGEEKPAVGEEKPAEDEEKPAVGEEKPAEVEEIKEPEIVQETIEFTNHDENKPFLLLVCGINNDGSKTVQLKIGEELVPASELPPKPENPPEGEEDTGPQEPLKRPIWKDSTNEDKGTKELRYEKENIDDPHGDYIITMLVRDPIKPRPPPPENPEEGVEEEEYVEPEPTYKKKIVADYYMQKDIWLYRDQEEKEISYKDTTAAFRYKIMREEDTENAKIKKKIIKIQTTIIHPHDDSKTLLVWRRGSMYENSSDFYLQKKKYVERDETEIDLILHDVNLDNEEEKKSKTVTGFYDDATIIYFREERDFEQEKRDADQIERYDLLKEVIADDPEVARQEAEEIAFQEEQAGINASIREKVLTPAIKKRIICKNNPAIIKAMSDLWHLFDKDYYSQISVTQFKHFMKMAYKILVPNAQEKQLEHLVDEDIYLKISLQTQKISFITYADILIDFCDITLESSLTHNYLTFLKFLLEKLSVRYNKNLDGTHFNIPYHFELTFYESDVVHEAIKRDNVLTEQPTNVLYVNEKKVYEYDSIEINFDMSLEYNLFKNFSDLDPLGMKTSFAIDNFVNSKKFDTKVKVINGDILSKYTSQDEKLFYISFVLQDENGRPSTRLNPAIFRPFFYEKLKSKCGSEEMFFNTKDIFLANNLNIDEIYRLNKNWVKPPLDDSELNTYEICCQSPSDNAEEAKTTLIRNKEKFYVEDEKYRKEIDAIKTIADFDPGWNTPAEKLENFISGDSHLPIDNGLPDEDDLIQYAKQRPLQILLHGKPKCGKSKIAKNQAKALDLEIIDFELFLQNFLARVKEGEENVETDEEGNAIEFLTVMERDLYETLKTGQRVSTSNMLALMKQEMKKLKLDLKGFVFELPVYQSPNDDQNFLTLINENYFELPNHPNPFNYSIDLNYSDEEVMFRARKVLENQDPENYSLTSRYDREEIIRLKEKAEWQRSPDFEGEPDDDLDPDAIIVLNPNDLYMRVNESDYVVQKALDFYNNVLHKGISEIEGKLPHTHNIQIDSGSLTPDEIIECIKVHVGEHARILRPLPIKLEDIGDFPSLLTAEIDEDGKPNRRWSLFYTVDPVSLNGPENLVKYGKPEFACDYAGRAFVFNSEENLEKFLKSPKIYLQDKPRLPKNYNIAIIGMSKSGKSKFAKKLAEQYPLKVLELDEFMTKIIEKQSSYEEHINSNPLNGVIHLNKNQFSDFQRGTEFSAKEILPILLHENGIELYKRPPPPKEEEEVDDEEQLKRQREEEAKKKKQQKKKKDDMKNSNEPEPPEDIPLNELVPKPDANGVIPELRGFIFIDFPSSEEQINAMKEANIILDCVIILKEGEEDEPGAFAKKREDFFEGALIEQELAFMEKSVAILKENYEDQIKEIVMTTEEETFTAVRQAADPFFMRIDDDAFMRPFDRENLDAEQILYGEYADYDPVIFKDEGWLIYGSEELEVQVRGKRYRFLNEDTQSKFKNYLPKYQDIPLVQPEKGNPNNSHQILKMPDFRLFMMGTSGAGLRTQLRQLRDDLKLPVLKLKEDYLNVAKLEKRDRKEERRLRNGFIEKEQQENAEAEAEEKEDDGLDDEEGEENIIDPEDAEEDDEEEQDPDFKHKVEIDLAKKILPDNMESCLLESNWFFDESEQKKKPETEFLDMLKETNRLPEIMIFVTCNEKNMLARCLDEKKITERFNKRMEKINTLKEKKRKEKLAELEAERAQKIADGEEFDTEEPLEVNEEEINAIYEDKIIPLDAMLEKEREKLKEKRNQQLDVIQPLFEALQEMKVQVFMIDSNRSVEKTYQNVNYVIKDALESRDCLLQRHRVVIINDSEDKEELTIEKKIQLLEKSYCFKKSRFLDKYPDDFGQLGFNQDYPQLFNDRIYFAKDSEHRELIRNDPLKYLSSRAPPHDIRVNLSMWLIGKPFSGLSSLAREISKELGIVFLKTKDILKHFLANPFDIQAKKLRQTIRSGKEIDDDLIVDLIYKRIQFPDVVANGYILQGYPNNCNQVQKLIQKGIIPMMVFSNQQDDIQIKNRAYSKKINKNTFKLDPEIVDCRVKQATANIPLIERFFLGYYQNLRYVNSTICIEGNVVKVRKDLSNALKQRYNVAQEITEGRPFDSRCIMLKNKDVLFKLSHFMNYSPIFYKLNRSFTECNLFEDYRIYYKRRFYFLHNKENVEEFMENPDEAIKMKPNFEKLPYEVQLTDVTSSSTQLEYELGGHCPVELYKNKLIPGRKHMSLEYLKKIYCFSSHKNYTLFSKYPHIFENVRLPYKLPVNPNPKAIVDAHKHGNIMAYLENYLSKIIASTLNYLAIQRLKYPKLSCKETTLKLLAICLKAANPNKSDYYRQKYANKCKEFIRHCVVSKELMAEASRRKEEMAVPEDERDWSDADEEGFLQLAEEYEELLKNMNATDKRKYFERF